MHEGSSRLNKEQLGIASSRTWDCSQIDDEEEEGKKENQMEMQWAEGEEVMQTVPELVKKKVKGWSTEEMTGKPNSLRVEGGTNQEDIDKCWRELAEKMGEEVLDNYKFEISEREAYRGRGAPLEWSSVRRTRKKRIRTWGEDC